MSIYTIYKSVNTKTGKVYIGFDSNWPNRLKVHKSASKKQDSKFYRAVRKYGWDNFEWSIVYQSKDKQHTLKQMETYFINEYNSMKSGYNSTLGGDGCFGLILSEEARKKISQANKIPKPQTPEHIKNRIESLKKNTNAFMGMLGKAHKMETKNKISLSNKGVPKTEEHKSKMPYQTLNKTSIQCPHCHKVGQYVNMKRWHFDNCKLGPKIPKVGSE